VARSHLSNNIWNGLASSLVFFIILLIFFIPLLRKLLVDKKKTEQKEEVEEEFYEEEELELPPPPPPQIVRPIPATGRLVKKDFEFHADIEEREYKSLIEARHLEMQEAPQIGERVVSQNFILEKKKKRGRENVIESVVKERAPGQAMVILSEIFGKPKGLS